MTPKGIAAVALILIIGCPIILGYALASNDTEVTVEKDTDTTSLTDLLFNAQSDYYIDYNKINNNADMIQRITAQGNTYYTYVSPDYVKVSDNYSSIPAYTTTSHETVFPSEPDYTTQTINIPSDPSRPGGVLVGSTSNYWTDWGNNAGRVIGSLGSTNYYLLTSTGGQQYQYVYIDGVADTSYPVWDYANAGGIQSDTLSAVKTADGWDFEVNGTHYTGQWAYICVSPSGSVSVNTYDYNEVKPQAGGETVEDWHLEMPDVGSVRITKGGVYSYYGVKSVSHTPAFTMVGDLNVGKPDKVEVSYPIAVLSYYTKTYSQYADPSYGWHNATSSFPIYWNAWYNQYENKTVTFYVHFDGNGRSEFYEDFSAVSPLLQLTRVNGTVIASNQNGSETLGTYANARIVFDTEEDTITVSGVSSFPPMGGNPTLLNTVTLDYDFDGYIEQLKIMDQYTSLPLVVADNYTTNGNSITITRPIATPYYTLGLRDSNGDAVPSSQWSATMGGDYKTVTFTPTSLPDGLYTFFIASPQVGSYSETIYIGNSGTVSTSPISYRVDNAVVVAGQYPSTVDYTLNVWGLYPNDTYHKVYLNSIGVYGDTIAIAGHNYTVTNGTITVTDAETGDVEEVKLLKMSIVMTLADGKYTTYVNGIPVTVNGNTAPTVYFGGEWSLTATRNTVTEETVVKTEWVPGEFALDQDGFVLAMLLTAVGTFLVLGMSGARSGAKVGLLALICGGAVVVGLLII